MKRKQIWKQTGVLILAAAMVIAAIGWAVTSRGYIRTEWIEVDPE